ncbi:MAG: hypothetical protein U1E63_03055 [Burkholderiales bacterium]
MLNPNYWFAYVILAFAVTAGVVRLTRGGIQRWIAGTLTLTGFWLFGHIDDFLGAREHRDLCAKEAGVKIYRKADLPPEFYNADGTPNFMETDGPDWRRLRDYVRLELHKTENHPAKYLRTDKYTTQIVKVPGGEVLAQKVDFAVWPSPFIPSIEQGVAKGCFLGGARENIDLSMEMFRNIFTK